MTIQAALKKVTEGVSLGRDEMRDVMRSIMTGEATPAQIGGFLIAERMKGETVDEITAAAEVMRELATPVDIPDALRETMVDTCGTGGDASGLFNVSTAAAVVVAAAGGHVAKHGNRSVSSGCGSADILEAAGVKLDLDPDAVARCIQETGIGFMFAPGFHGAMKHAIGPRREMAVRTLFNILGPLTNPAGVRNQVLGVFSPDWLEPLAEVLGALGSRHVMVVHSNDGLDEISLAQPTQVAELKDGNVRRHEIAPGDFGIDAQSIDSLKVADAAESLSMIRGVFSGTPGPAADMVAINAAAALYVSGLAGDLADGLKQARKAISEGAAADKLEQFATLTQGL